MEEGGGDQGERGREGGGGGGLAGQVCTGWLEGERGWEAACKVEA